MNIYLTALLYVLGAWMFIAIILILWFYLTNSLLKRRYKNSGIDKSRPFPAGETGQRKQILKGGASGDDRVIESLKRAIFSDETPGSSKGDISEPVASKRGLSFAERRSQWPKR